MLVDGEEYLVLTLSVADPGVVVCWLACRVCAIRTRPVECRVAGMSSELNVANVRGNIVRPVPAVKILPSRH